MQYLPFALIALACPVGMGLMMLFMGRGMMGMGKKDDVHSEFAEPDDPDKRLAVLQAQRALIDAQMAAMSAGEPSLDPPNQARAEA